jgi:hypothetical protein
VLTYDDWVVSVASRGGHLLVAAGAEVCEPESSKVHAWNGVCMQGAPDMGVTPLLQQAGC